MKYSKSLTISIILMVICLIFTGCDENFPVLGTEPAACTATFMVGGEVYLKETVAIDSAPKGAIPSGDSFIFRYWVDADGQQVLPEQIPLSSDTTYTAVCYPVLSRHVPFLFMGSDNKLHPEADLTPATLRHALGILADEGANRFFPQLPEGGNAVTSQVLRDLLVSFYPEDQVNLAFDGIEDKTLTRGDFAVIMCRLQHRIGETLTVAESAVLPADIHAGMDQLEALLEASMEHSCTYEGIKWSTYSLPVDWEPGFVLENGWLYYVKEDGYLLRNEQMGMLYFGENGRYTSGDAELDQLVADILRSFTEKNPEMDRFDLLYEAHVYCRDSFKYLRRNSYAIGAKGWEIEDAKTMFNKGRGNCYNYAAAFWALARGLGYEARAVSGTCTGSNQSHGWVFIEFDGKDYIFDCEWEMAYRTEREIYNMNMFMIPSNKWSYWTYKW
jgi:hypothetical protein